LIIKELELTNIRSHGHSVIDFPLGKTLLEGDIGSGKSSVLIGIEFALFGLGPESGNSILKLGEDSGEVRMVFEVDGYDYQIRRRLQRKGGKIQQIDGELKMPSETIALSPSELKERVLETLEFNEAPDPKAQSWIYRYAVYTPQEDMKSILVLAPEQRLQILRRAFRVEDYKTAAINAEESAKYIREEAREQDGIATGMGELRSQVHQLQADEEKQKAELTKLEDAETADEGHLLVAKAEKEALQKREISLQNVKAEKEYYERLEAEAAKDAIELGDEVAELRLSLRELENSLIRTDIARPSAASSLPELKKRERALEAKAKKLTELKAATEAKLSDYESIMKNGVCPVCDRPVGTHDFEEKRGRKEAERGHLAEELAAVEAEILTLRGKIEEYESYKYAVKEAAHRRVERARLRVEIERKEQSKRKFDKRATFAKSTLQQLGKQLDELSGLAKEMETADKKLAKSEERLRATRDRLIKTRSIVESIQKRQTEIAIEIVAKEEASNKSKRLRAREIWLEDYFVPTVKLIEKSVLATINQEFDSLFKRWFGMLVNDPDKEVGVDEDFSPVVTQGGYEQDVRYLSGGERTSIALAYRLALNVITQRVSVGMKSNLLILDEPTDGFSKEQLGTVREVLDDVGCPQIIIVSHDKELESFADQIFRVEKSGSESTVRVP
jgi:exonuclease SbcC